MRQADNTAQLRRALRMGNLYSYKGKIRSSVGMTLEATGVTCNVGDICEIRLASGQIVLAEVIGIRDEITVLMPYQDVDGIGSGSVAMRVRWSPPGSTKTLMLRLPGTTLQAAPGAVHGSSPP